MGATALAGCTESADEAVVVDNPAADSVVFWPPTMKYARQGDTLYLYIRGLKRRAECAVPLQVGWKFRQDTTQDQYYRARSSFEIPAGASCAPDAQGIDTLFRVRFFTRIGNRLFLETPDSVVTDSIGFIAGDAPNLASAVTLRHVAGGPDSTIADRFTFRDSTASHPQRVLRVASLATCEILQTAVYDIHRDPVGSAPDTTIVKIRLIQASPRPASVFPPCAGPRSDSLEVVFNRFNFLP
jgi:hypothetical protein